MFKQTIFTIFVVVLYLFAGMLVAKEYNKTSYYVAYDRNDTKQYVLVLPSVHKIYTHEAGHIAASDLKPIDTQFVSFPTYQDGNLTFPALKATASGDDGASIMAGKSYEVKFFYTQKEVISEGVAFILFYAPADKVYEGLAGDSESFEVVREGKKVYNENSITNDDYTAFVFDTNTGTVQGVIEGEEDITDLNKVLAGKTLYTSIDEQMGTLESWAFNEALTNVTWTEIVGGSYSDMGTVSINGMVISVSDSDSSATVTVNKIGKDYLTVTIEFTEDGVQHTQNGRLYFDEAKARTYLLSDLNKVLAGKTLYTSIDEQMGTLESWAFNEALTNVTWTEIVGGSYSDMGTVSINGMVISVSDSDSSATVTVNKIGKDYLTVTIEFTEDGVQHTQNGRLYFDEAKARTYLLSEVLNYTVMSADILNGKTLYSSYLFPNFATNTTEIAYDAGFDYTNLNTGPENEVKACYRKQTFSLNSVQVHEVCYMTELISGGTVADPNTVYRPKIVSDETFTVSYSIIDGKIYSADLNDRYDWFIVPIDGEYLHVSNGVLEIVMNTDGRVVLTPSNPGSKLEGTQNTWLLKKPAGFPSI